MSSEPAHAPSADQLLTPAQLVERWNKAVTLGTLATWRSRGGGPPFIRVGRQPLYRVADVEAYEQERRKT